MKPLTLEQKQTTANGIPAAAIKLVHAAVMISWVVIDAVNIYTNFYPKEPPKPKEFFKDHLIYDNSLISSKNIIGS